MNAKKIMGAVLVALLAAALFVGAASAAATTDLGTVFESQVVDGDVFNGNWVNNGKTVVISNGVVGPVAEAGTYTKGDYTVYITKPTASYSLTGTVGASTQYIVANGGNVYLESTNLALSVVALNSTVDVQYIMITFPSGAYLKYDKAYFASATLEKGTYKVQAIFEKGDDFVAGVDDALLLDQLNSFTFTVIDVSDATITANVDTVYKGDAVKFTITGVPGTQYKLDTEDFNIPTNQYVSINADHVFTMPNNGVAEFAATVEADKKATVVLKYNDGNDWVKVDDGKIEITVSKPVITITLGAPAYFIGDKIELTGESTFEVTNNYYTFNITGVNFKSTAIPNVDWDETGKTWTVVLPTAGLTEVETEKTLDVGTYTIEIIKGGDVVKTATVRLNQPFISIVDAPEVVTQGTDAEFVINAEATQNGIAAYIFGTNFFMNLTKDITQEDAKKFPTQYTVTIDEKITDNMSTGQYFMVFQHPMYDQEFNIFEDAGKFKLLGNSVPLFDVYDRQTANAAQALCDALDSQNIDDMYVKYSFFLVGEDESFTISDIPKEIAKGTTLVISGVDTANAEKEVVVQMLSTAFAAVPKETVGSAAFILVTTEVAEDGSWEVTLDTSDLNVDEYSLSVAIDSVTKKNVNINVVEAGDEPVTPEQPEEPEQPEQPEEPVAPATPGFGALAALAGLGAVAVLLLRRE